MVEHTYKSAGVDRNTASEIVRRVGALAATTAGPQVIGGVGGFGALYELAGFSEPVLVSSTDGVGTKLKVAATLRRFEGLGEDVVNACVNDVVVLGARPLFFLDYLAMGELDVDAAEALATGMARACREVGCAMIGGETAEMPGIYAEGDFDLAGFVVGAVEKSEIVDGSTIRDGDVLVGLPSNGLHTNGFSLVRHVLGLDADESPLHEYHAELGETLGDALLRPHTSYYNAVSGAFPSIKGMAHITGGGLLENVPRVLPDGLFASFDTSSWTAPPIFAFLQERSNVGRDEMYRVFNMGLGMVLACDASEVKDVLTTIDGAVVVGSVEVQSGQDRVGLR